MTVRPLTQQPSCDSSLLSAKLRVEKHQHCTRSFRLDEFYWQTLFCTLIWKQPHKVNIKLMLTRAKTWSLTFTCPQIFISRLLISYQMWRWWPRYKEKERVTRITTQEEVKSLSRTRRLILTRDWGGFLSVESWHLKSEHVPLVSPPCRNVSDQEG